MNKRVVLSLKPNEASTLNHLIYLGANTMKGTKAIQPIIDKIQGEIDYQLNLLAEGDMYCPHCHKKSKVWERDRSIK